MGDCDGDGTVTVSELIIGVNLSLESEPRSCAAFDRNGDTRVTVDELVLAVNHALHGCPKD